MSHADLARFLETAGDVVRRRAQIADQLASLEADRDRLLAEDHLLQARLGEFRDDVDQLRDLVRKATAPHPDEEPPK